MSQNNNNPKYYYAIDAAKLVCALLVVVNHSMPFGYNEAFFIPNQIARNFFARVAVPFFFISSGFFYFKSNSYENYEIPKMKKYVSRILFLYVAWSAIYFPQHISGIIHDKQGAAIGVLKYLRDFCFDGGHHHLWYLRSLAVAILIVSFFIKKNVKPEKILLISVFPYIIGLLGQGYSFLLYPLKKYDSVWNFIIMLKNIFLTTRNGVFEGFMLISLSLILATRKSEIDQKRSLALFLISTAAFGGEVFMLYKITGSAEHDVFICMLPADYFMFKYLSTVQLKPNGRYKMMRKMSSLVYFTHPLIKNILQSILKRINEGLTQTSVLFLLTVAVSLAASYCAVKISDVKGFKWLKKLY